MLLVTIQKTFCRRMADTGINHVHDTDSSAGPTAPTASCASTSPSQFSHKSLSAQSEDTRFASYSSNTGK